jgi:hypothetical protein
MLLKNLTSKREMAAELLAAQDPLEETWEDVLDRPEYKTRRAPRALYEQTMWSMS